MRIGKIAIVVLSCAVALAGCGGGTAPRPDIYNDQNAWSGPVPADADIITPNEFSRMFDSGEVSLTNDALMAAAAERLEEQFDSNVEALQQATDLPPTLQELLAEVTGVEDYAGDVAVQLPGGHSVVLEGLGTSVENAVHSYQRAHDVDNALSDYAQTYMLLSDDLKAQVPTPESLAGASLETVLSALHSIDVALEGDSTLRSARVELQAQAPGAGAIEAAAIQPGVGDDQNPACAQPTGIAAEYWFPLKNFISPIKDQGNRGTCWAFTAIGAIESRERVQNANPVNLSEQFLVNKVKEDWDESDFTDGYSSERALNTAVDEGQQIPNEGAWTYNPAPNRDGNLSGNAAAYAGTCNPYGVGPNAGTCSETAHQSRRVCTTFVVTVCGYATVTFGGPGIGASNAYQLWANGQSFDLNRYRMLLSQGYTIMASFPVYKGFMDDVTSNGIVSNYAKTRLNATTGVEENGSYGNHAVQIVGFIDNATMSKPGRTPANVGGGGYFIIKNSWGCTAGDGGYYYVPADYVRQLFNSLQVMNFDMRRSAAWTAEQTTPGGSEAPTITIKSNPALVDLRVSTNLATAFGVAHPVAKSVTLKISSTALGTLYNGPWSTDKDALIGPIFNYTFQQAGDQYLTLEARYGSSVRTANLLVRVVNSAPTITLEYSGNAYLGEAYSFSAKVADKNETDVGALCSRTTWSVSGSDVLSATSGCQVKVTFGAEGTRTVTATTKDAENQVTNKSASVFVYPARPNPYPIITSSGVYRRDAAFIGNTFIGCVDYTVGTGSTIVLSEKGCSLTGTQPQRYSGQVEVDNPSGEALTYTFRLYVGSGTPYEQLYTSLFDSPEPYFQLYNRYNSGLGTEPCHVTVTVNAPESSRNKSATVWTGRCTYYSFQLN